MAHYTMVGAEAVLTLEFSASLDDRTAYLQLTLEGTLSAQALLLVEFPGAVIVLDGPAEDDGVYTSAWDADAAVLTLTGDVVFYGGFGIPTAVLTLTAEAAVTAATVTVVDPADLVLTLDGAVVYLSTTYVDPADLTLNLVGDVVSRAVVSGDANLNLSGTQAQSDTIGWHVSARVSGVALLLLESDAELSATTAEGVDADSEAAALGYRRGLARLVYHLGVTVVDETDDVPTGEAFLMSAGFIGMPGDPLYDSGAGAGYIGFKRGTTLDASFAFRPPYPNEVVWYEPTDTLYRWEVSRDTGRASWRKYLSIPERFVAGVKAFELFDPDGVYAYTARIAGSMLTQMQQDNAVISRLRDPAKVPEDLIPEASKSLDTVIPATGDFAKARASLAMVVPTGKLRGLSESVNNRLRSVGYRGWVAEVWRRMDWSALEVSQVPAGPVFTSVTSSKTESVVVVSAPDGSFVVYCWRDNAPGVDQAAMLAQQVALREEMQAITLGLLAYPGPRAAMDAAVVAAQSVEAVALTDLALAYTRMSDVVTAMEAAVAAAETTVPEELGLNDRISYALIQEQQLQATTDSNSDIDITIVSPSLTRVFRISPMSVPSGVTAIAGGGTTAAAVIANLRAAIIAVFGAGTSRLVDDSWDLFIEYPHGYIVDEPGAYWVSNQVIVHANYENGALAYLSATARRNLVADLLLTVLPVHVRVRGFATDAEAGEDAVAVGDAFEIVVL